MNEPTKSEMKLPREIKDGVGDYWSWQSYVNNTFPTFIVFAIIVLTLMVIGAYVIV